MLAKVILGLFTGIAVVCAEPPNFNSGKTLTSFTDLGSSTTISGDINFTEQVGITTTTLPAGNKLNVAENITVTYTTHTALIHVQKGGNVTNNTASGQRVVGVFIQNELNGTGGSQPSSSVGLHIEAAGGDNNYAMINSTGNFGIGTLTPGQKFDVLGGTIAITSDRSANRCRVFTSITATCPTGSTSIDAGATLSLCAQCD